MEVVADSIEYFSGNSCNEAFNYAAEKVSQLVLDGPGSEGYSTLQKDFATCEEIKTDKDLTILLSNLMGYVQGTVQYNNEQSSSLNITNICGVMLDGANVNKDYDAYTQFVALAAKFRAQYGLTCEDVSWEHTISYLSDPTKNPSNNMRPWTYQTCNEFGYFQTTDSKVCYSINLCA
jgi:hypothetical protein